MVTFSIHIYHFILPAAEAIVLPYIELGTIEAVETHTLPRRDDFVSDAINVEFPFGESYLSTVHVRVLGSLSCPYTAPYFYSTCKFYICILFHEFT